MKVGFRTPSLKKSFKARTTGKLKRKMKKAINPFYGKKGMGYIKNPKRAIKNKIYHKTTFGVNNVTRATAHTMRTNISGENTMSSQTNNFDGTTNLLIVIFGGAFGLHKFLSGEIGMGFLYLFTGGLFGIGWIIDIIKCVQAEDPEKKAREAAYLFNWQKTIYPQYNELVMTQAQLQQATNQYAQDLLNTIKMCANVQETTVHADIYFEKMETLYQSSKKLVELEPYANFLAGSASPTMALREFEMKYQQSVRNFIERAFESTRNYVAKLKTDEGKKKNYIRLYEELKKYSDRMDSANNEVLEEFYEAYCK